MGIHAATDSAMPIKNIFTKEDTFGVIHGPLNTMLQLL